MKSPVDQIVSQLKNYDPQKIILFGSYAYGKQTAESDIDIALIKKTDQPFHQRLKEVRLLLKTTTPIDVFVFTPEEFEQKKKSNPLIEEIATKGKILYG